MTQTITPVRVGLLSELPAIITQPGFYRTRDGRKAFIREINQSPIMLSNGFAAKGGIEREFRGKMKISGHHIWHVSGHSEALYEKGADIVGVWNIPEP